jgi:membrane protein
MSSNIAIAGKISKPVSPGFVQIVKTSVSGFLDHECLNLAAGIVYYTLQSLVPLLLGFIAGVSLFLQDAASRKSFEDAVKSALPSDVEKTINLSQTLDGLAAGAGAIGVLSLVLLLWTGSGIFAQLMVAINKSFGIPKDKRSFITKLGLRLVMLPVLGLLIVLSVVISAGLQIILSIDVNIFGVKPSDFSILLVVVGFITPILIETGAFAVLYRLSPNRKGLRWKPMLIGGLVAAILIELLKVGFSFYVTSLGAASNAAKTYGALGGIIVFLLFIYLFAAIILFGAEVAAALHNFPPEAPAPVSAASTSADGTALPAGQVALTAQTGLARIQPGAKRTPKELGLGAAVLITIFIGGLISQRKKTP